MTPARAWRSAAAGILVFMLVGLADAQARPDYGPEAWTHIASNAERVALIGVTLIDGTGAAPRERQTVLIEGARIVAVGDSGSVEIPADAERLDLAGRTVIPGLVGAHDHLHLPGVPLLHHSGPRLYLAGGVTTIRTTGSAAPVAERNLAAAIGAGRGAGPRIVASAPYFTGPNGNAVMDRPGNEVDARAAVAYWATAGASWIKLYRHIEPEIAGALIDEAHRHGLRVAIHPCSLSYRDAAELGVDSIEHGMIAMTDFVPNRAAGECPSWRSVMETHRNFDPQGDAAQALFADLVAPDVTLVSTLAIIESHFAHRPQGEARALELMAPFLRDAYEVRQADLAARGHDTLFTPDLFARLLAFERAFVSAGGRLAMGPDPGRHVLPGFGNQRGFELLVEAGFTPAEAVRIATLNGAELLGLEGEAGSVEAGKLADLVVLSGDLAQDASVIRQVEHVFRLGTRFDPDSLLRGLEGQVGLW